MAANSGRKWGGDNKEEKVTCSLVIKPDIYIDVTARQKIGFLMEEYTSREWLAYLLGYISEKGNFFVEDLLVPPHAESLYGSAEAEPLHAPKEGCIGIIHSHHKIGAFHSGTDKDYVDRNFPISIVVARDDSGVLKYDAVGVADTPCGKAITMSDCSVNYLQPEPSFDAEKWLEEAKKQIDKGEYKFNKTTCPVYPVQYLGAAKGVKKVRTTQGALPETEVPLSDAKPPWYLQKQSSLITNKTVREIRKKIHEDRDVLLTRAQIEDWLQTSVPPVELGTEAL